MDSKEYYSMSVYARGKYVLKNPAKYTGKKTPTYRSSWEWAFMNFCDNNSNVLHWASESINIPYFNPFTNKQTIYVPDFFVLYQDKNGRNHAEMIEIKPSGEVMETVGKGIRNQAMAALNAIKWDAARKWCANHGVFFRVITEADMFQNTKKPNKFKVR